MLGADAWPPRRMLRKCQLLRSKAIALLDRDAGSKVQIPRGIGLEKIREFPQWTKSTGS